MSNEQLYRVNFEIADLGLYAHIPGLISAMKSELMRVYNLYAHKTNEGITDKLNEEFENLNPSYFEDNKDKDWDELVEYNQYIADGYMRLVVDDFNKNNISPILDFYVNPKELQFTGHLKTDKSRSITFYMTKA